MKYYHPKKSPLTIYERKMAITIIQGYDDMCAKLDSMLQSGVVMDGMPHAKTPGDPVGSAVIRRLEKSRYVDAVNKALNEIPPEYRKIVFKWVKSGKTLAECGADYAHRNTYSHWRNRLIEYVAINAGIHEEWR